MRRDKSEFLTTLAAALVGLAPLPASASDLAWTNCYGLVIGEKQHTECQRCTAKGSGWRFYMSRDGSQTECRRDPQARTSPTRTPEYEKRERSRPYTPPVQRTVIPTPAAPPKIHSHPRQQSVERPAPAIKAETRQRPAPSVSAERRATSIRNSTPPRYTHERPRASSPTNRDRPRPERSTRRAE